MTIMTIRSGYCLQCESQRRAGESLFCSPACRATFAQDMAETITCFECDAQADGIAEATESGWTGVESDPEGFSWNYLGLCPGCAIVEGKR